MAVKKIIRNFYQQIRVLLQRELNPEHFLENKVKFLAPLHLNASQNDVYDVRMHDDSLEIDIAKHCLTGAHGVLPVAYTEWLVDRQFRYADTSAIDFFNIFNTRAQIIKYRAWIRYHYYAQFELTRKKPLEPEISALIGNSPDNKVLSLYVLPVKSMAGLERYLQTVLDERIEVHPFYGQWRKNKSDVLCQLGNAACSLDQLPAIGQVYWDIQNNIHLVVGPILPQYIKNYMINGDKFCLINQVINLWSGEGFDLIVDILVEHSHNEKHSLGISQLGINSLVGERIGGYSTLRIKYYQ